jgi:hypothetical protein
MNNQDLRTEQEIDIQAMNLFFNAYRHLFAPYLKDNDSFELVPDSPKYTETLKYCVQTCEKYNDYRLKLHFETNY